MVAFTVPNMVGLYNDAFATGRGQARDRGVQNALAIAPTDPTGAQNALMRYGAVQEAGQLSQMQERQQKTQGAQRARQLMTAGNRTGAMEEAVFSGNTELAQGLKGLDDARLEAADRAAQKTGGVAYNLKSVADPAQRVQLGTTAVQAMVQSGDMTPEQGQAVIAKGFDDATLDGYVNEALGLKSAIDREMEERKFKVGREDRQQDVTFRGEQFEETKRGNRVSEGQRQQALGYDGARLGLERERLGIARQEAAAKARGGGTSDMRVQSARNVIGVADSALGKLGRGEAGLVGERMSKVAGTKAYDLNRDIETIKANLGFEQLQAMREASPTGGALGQVAVQELVALQATVANLDIGQSEAQLRANLNKVKGHYQRWLNTVDQGGASPQGSGGGADPLGIR